MKTDPKYGFFASWPENGSAWIHPEDVDHARQVVPSNRILRRDGRHGSLVVMHYGDLRFRIRPTLWNEVEHEGFDVGDWIEVRTRGLTNEPRTGTIREMLWDQNAGRIHYQITENDLPVPNLYTADDLKHIEPTAPLDA